MLGNHSTTLRIVYALGPRLLFLANSFNPSPREYLRKETLLKTSHPELRVSWSWPFLICTFHFIRWITAPQGLIGRVEARSGRLPTARHFNARGGNGCVAIRNTLGNYRWALWIVLLELTRWLRCTGGNKSRMLGHGPWTARSEGAAIR